MEGGAASKGCIVRTRELGWELGDVRGEMFRNPRAVRRRGKLPPEVSTPP